MWKEKAGGKRKSSKENRERRGQRDTKGIGTQEILEVEKSIWKERVRNNASAKGLGSCDRVKRGVCAKKGEGVFIVERRERGGTGIYGGPTKKKVYLTF